MIKGDKKNKLIELIVQNWIKLFKSPGLFK